MANPKIRAVPCIAPRIVQRADEIVTMLRQRKLTLVTAESCTGGLIAAALSQADGASDVLEGAFVTYTKDQKVRALGIPRRLLLRESAVSLTVAKQMAIRARSRSKADVGFSITGVLGPAPDEDGNPVGLVIIGIVAECETPQTVQIHFELKNHDQLLCQAILTAFEVLEKTLLRSPQLESE